MTSANDFDSRDPLDWRIEGSNDGVTFTTLDTVTGFDFPMRFQREFFTIAMPMSFQIYRLVVDSINSGPLVQLAELEYEGFCF